MKLSMPLVYAGNPREAADHVAGLEKAGLDTVWVAEPYGFDSPTLMGYLAAKTETVEIGAGILNIYSRTPGALLQTAAGLDNVSGGRAVIGLGASGPQVIEGFHGVPYDKPLGRTREIVDIMRRGLRRETLTNDGIYKLPLPADQGTRPRQAAQAAQQARAQGGPDLHRRARPEVRPGHGRVRRRLAAVPVPPREGPSRLGRRAREGPRQAPGRTGPARDLRRRHGRDRRGREGDARLHAPDVRALRRRHGRPRQELLQRPRLPVRLREGGQGDPGPLPRRQQARRRGEGAAGVARGRQPGRPGVVRQGADRRLPRGRRHQPPGRARLRRPGRHHRARSRSGCREAPPELGHPRRFDNLERVRALDPDDRLRRDRVHHLALRVPVGLRPGHRHRLPPRLRRPVDRPAARPDP